MLAFLRKVCGQRRKDAPQCDKNATKGGNRKRRDEEEEEEEVLNVRTSGKVQLQ